MKRLVKFLQLRWSDRFLLVITAFLLGMIRLALWLLPFQTVHRLLARITPRTTELQQVDQDYINKVVWAVVIASPYIPGVKCLAQALATQVMVEWRGYPTQVRIGITRNKKGQLLAHAWVESQGKVVIGGAGNMACYIPVSLPEVKSDESDSWHLLT
ncbi:lasso peptide biosynthesis B2 protein [Floridanema aerugineum]|uniref:Lasso peptide biosynthesis B2 protein n=1 Tax=Floridaenema aerugineum BLCC-F46 TaxID=3153654 RepID=A0ABV4XCW4_9CYAN